MQELKKIIRLRLHGWMEKVRGDHMDGGYFRTAQGFLKITTMSTMKVFAVLL